MNCFQFENIENTKKTKIEIIFYYLFIDSKR